MVAVQAVGRAGVACAPTADDGRLRSVALREQMLARWRDEVRHKPPGEREAWLQTTEAFVVLGARRCKELLRQIRGARAEARNVACSDAWFVAAVEHGQQFPPGGVAGTAMVRSREATRYGAAFGGDPYPVPGMTSAHERWTPPQAVATEDFLDGLHPREALFYQHPPSPSAMAIFVSVTYGPDARPRVARPPGKSGVRRERLAVEQARQTDPR